MPDRPAFVLDCSVTLAWYFKDEADAYADAVQEALVQAEAVVPALWPLEVANALVVGERRGRSTEAQATSWLKLLQALPITIDDRTAACAWKDTLRLARAKRISAYDATYLELCLRRNLPVATLDKRLRDIATELGIRRYGNSKRG